MARSAYLFLAIGLLAGALLTYEFAPRFREPRTIGLKDGAEIASNAVASHTTVVEESASPLDPPALRDQSRPLAGNGALRAKALELGRRDPTAAFEFVEVQGRPSQQEDLLSAVVQGWAQVDPDAALQWARSQSSPLSTTLERAAYRGMAVTDPRLALDFAARDGDADTVYAVVVAAIDADPPRAIDMAEASLRIVSAELRDRALEGIITRTQIPDEVMQWLASNSHRVPISAFDHMAGKIGRSYPGRFMMLDPVTAASFTDRIPAEARDNWIASAGRAFAREDPNASMAWAESLRGQAGFATAVGAVALHVAETDPKASVDFVARSQLDFQSATPILTSVATIWAQEDPQAVLGWAQTLTVGEQDKVSILRAAIRGWSRSDANAAETWTLAMPRGATRDEVLGTVLISSAVSAQAPPFVDPVVLRAFDSDLRRQEKLLVIIREIASKDPEATRALIEEYFVDPTMRAQADKIVEDAIEYAARGPVATRITLGR